MSMDYSYNGKGELFYGAPNDKPDDDDYHVMYRPLLLKVTSHYTLKKSWFRDIKFKARVAYGPHPQSIHDGYYKEIELRQFDRSKEVLDTYMAKVRFRRSSKNFLLNLYICDGPLAHQSTWNQLGTYQEWFALVHLHHYNLLEFWEPRMGIEECQHICRRHIKGYLY